MQTKQISTKAELINYTDIAKCIADLDGDELAVPRLFAELRRQRNDLEQVVRQVHVITDSEGMPDNLRTQFIRAGATIHKSNGLRTEALTTVKALRLAEQFDVVTLVVADAGYLPLIREMKYMGARVELHAMPSADPALFPAADEVVGLYPPGAPLPVANNRRAA